MRIGVVNDLRIATEALVRAVRSGGHEVAWTAADGEQAVARCAADRPDVVLMDLIMPVMDGVEATGRIMAASPCPILVVTATVTGNATRVYEALGRGALDAVNTPTLSPDGSVAGAEQLLRRIELVRRLASGECAAPPAPTAAPARDAALPPVVAIGASTGGPQAIATLLRGLPRPLPWPVLAVQHLGAPFVQGLVEWLSRDTGLGIRVAADGDPLRPGVVLFPPGERHLVVDASSRVQCPEMPALLHRPSVDVLFEALAASPCRGVAVLLTGMGQDGAAGLAALRRRGWWTIAQDRATSVVWGMPGAAVRAEAACEVLPIDAIAASVARRIGTVTGTGTGARP